VRCNIRLMVAATNTKMANANNNLLAGMHCQRSCEQRKDTKFQGLKTYNRNSFLRLFSGCCIDGAGTGDNVMLAAPLPTSGSTEIGSEP
jgi:hypothetical protein